MYTCVSVFVSSTVIMATKSAEEWRLEEERVTPIEARSPGKIIEPY